MHNSCLSDHLWRSDRGFGQAYFREETIEAGTFNYVDVSDDVAWSMGGDRRHWKRGRGHHLFDHVYIEGTHLDGMELLVCLKHLYADHAHLADTGLQSKEIHGIQISDYEQRKQRRKETEKEPTIQRSRHPSRNYIDGGEGWFRYRCGAGKSNC